MITISIGPLAIPLDRLLLAAGFLVALVVGWWLGRRRDVSVEPALTGMLLIGLFGGRLVFVLQYLDDYLVRPLSIIDIRDGGFHFLAGVGLAALTGIVIALRQAALRQPLAVASLAGVLAWAGGQALADRLIEAPEMAPMPPLSLITLDGERINLHELNDRPVVLNLWATWCPPCRREMPVFEAAQQRESDIAFVFVNQGEDAQRIADYLYDDDLHLENVLLDAQSHSSLMLDTRALPSTYYFNAAGEMVEMHTGEVSRATLNRSLQQLR